MQKIRFGANYIPSKNWLHNWVDFDATSVEEDLYAANITRKGKRCRILTLTRY